MTRLRDPHERVTTLASSARRDVMEAPGENGFIFSVLSG
jgi:hypothetical protein